VGKNHGTQSAFTQHPRNMGKMKSNHNDNTQILGVKGEKSDALGKTAWRRDIFTRSAEKRTRDG